MYGFLRQKNKPQGGLLVDFFDILTLVGGLALFLFGMNVMSSAMEKCAGKRLKTILSRLTSNPMMGFLLGMLATAIVQSSSATTVMVVGFVNSGVMKLAQSVNITIGANVGAAITFWITSLTGLTSTSFLVQIFKPTSLAPIFGLIGIILFMFSKKAKRKDIGRICLGFAVLMFGMNTMSAAVAPMRDMPEFSHLMSTLSNPLLGLVVGTAFTALIQSSSASVGILQALSMTGMVTFSAAIPVMAGQNIGTCITALLACIGTSRDAKRAAMVHLYFNIIGAIVWLLLFYAANAIFHFDFMANPITPVMIALVQTISKLICTALFMPFRSQLEKLACLTMRDKKPDQEFALLDEHLFMTPTIAVGNAAQLTRRMAEKSKECMQIALQLVFSYSTESDEKVSELEDKVDEYEDKIGSYLVKLSSHAMVESDSLELTKLLHMLNDFERISDHAVNIAESARELREKDLEFSAEAKEEISSIIRAVHDILDFAIDSFVNNDFSEAYNVEPLEETVDTLRDTIKARHIERLKQGDCTIEMGFVLTDLLTNLERVADHCSNVAMCLLEVSQNRFDIHGYQRVLETGNDFDRKYNAYLTEYMPKDL